MVGPFKECLPKGQQQASRSVVSLRQYCSDGRYRLREQVVQRSSRARGRRPGASFPLKRSEMCQCVDWEGVCSVNRARGCIDMGKNVHITGSCGPLSGMAVQGTWCPRCGSSHVIRTSEAKATCWNCRAELVQKHGVVHDCAHVLCSVWNRYLKGCGKLQ